MAQAAAVDIVHSDKPLMDYPLAFLSGAPVIEDAVSRKLSKYVEKGNTLVVSGAWLIRSETGASLRFLGVASAKTTRDRMELTLGRGKRIWLSTCIAQDEAENENLLSI